MLALLDLDGTLVDRDAGFRDWLATFATEHHFDEAECAWLRACDQQTKGRGRALAALRQRGWRLVLVSNRRMR